VTLDSFCGAEANCLGIHSPALRIRQLPEQDGLIFPHWDAYGMVLLHLSDYWRIKTKEQEEIS